MHTNTTGGPHDRPIKHNRPVTPADVHQARMQAHAQVTYFKVLEAFLQDEIVLVRGELNKLSPWDTGSQMIFEGILTYLTARQEAVSRGLMEAEGKAS